VSGQVRLQTEGTLAFVNLSNPGKFNAMSRAMWLQLRLAFEALQARADEGVLRVIIVRGDDGHFCAGGDISEYASFRFAEASLRAFHEDEVWGALNAILACDIPVIAQIQGNCMGAGMEIASACDVRMASSDARFGAPIAKLGFPMAPREMALLLRVAGDATVREMLLSAAVLEAPLLYARGFLSQLYAATDLEGAVLARAAAMARLAPQAARMNKATMRALAQTRDGSVPQALLATAYAYADSAEHREGIAAFAAKRSPCF
jgi:enoyl-CoA hydratase/carnithine racemase